jgi:hypothetical protein
LSCGAFAVGEAELFSDGCPNCWSGLDDDSFAGVVDGVDHGLDVVDLCQSSGGTDVHTLTTEYTNGVIQVHHLWGSYDSVEASAVAAEDAHGLDVVTGGFTASTEDTFIQVPLDGFARDINGVLGLLSLR